MRNGIVGLLAGATCMIAAAGEAAELPQRVAWHVSPEIAKRLAVDPALAGAPSVTRKAFAYAYSYEWNDPKDPYKAKTDVSYQPLSEAGFVLERKIYEEGDGYRTTGESFFTAGGLLNLFEAEEITHPNGTKNTREMFLTAYEISGDLFPVAKGNTFKIKATMGGPFSMQLDHRCEVKREIKASDFSAALTGPAFHVLCAVNVARQSTSLQDYYYIQELNHFVPDFRSSDCAECKGFDLKVE
jgi:hypothetical protein